MTVGVLKRELRFADTAHAVQLQNRGISRLQHLADSGELLIPAGEIKVLRLPRPPDWERGERCPRLPLSQVLRGETHECRCGGPAEGLISLTDGEGAAVLAGEAVAGVGPPGLVAIRVRQDHDHRHVTVQPVAQVVGIGGPLEGLGGLPRERPVAGLDLDRNHPIERRAVGHQLDLAVDSMIDATVMNR